jgi:hypothetical protein
MMTSSLSVKFMSFEHLVCWCAHPEVDVMKTSTRLHHLLLAFGAVSLLALTANVGSASATPQPPTGPVTANWVSTGAGYSGVINIDGDPDLESAVIQNFKVEGRDTVGAYCIDPPVPFVSDSSVTYTSATWESTGKPNLSKVAFLATQSSTVPTPMADANAEASAVQLAIWSLTDNADIASVNNAAIRNRVAALLAAASTVSEQPSSFTLDIAAVQLDDTNVRLDVTFRTNSGAGQSGRPVTVTYPGGSKDVTTDASGNASFVIAAPASAGSATATWNGVLPAGSVIKPPSGQALITITDANITRSATAAVPAARQTPTTVPPTTTPPAPPTTAPGGSPVAPPQAAPNPDAATPVAQAAPTPSELPYTGTWVSTPLVLAAALALSLGVWLRRRARQPS